MPKSVLIPKAESYILFSYLRVSLFAQDSMQIAYFEIDTPILIRQLITRM